jgi:dihydroorotase
MAQVKKVLKNARLLDPASPFHKDEADIVLEEGVITDIGKGLSSEPDETIDLSGHWVMPSLMDLHAHYNEPGYEFKEELETGKRCARFSGFSDVLLVPNTFPVLDTRADVQYIRSQSGPWVDLHPMAAISVGLHGEQLTEILDLKAGGAVAFSEGLQPTTNHALLLKSLQYTAPFGGLIISRPSDPHLSKGAHMHEGLVSTRLGLTGEPAYSEKMQISNHLETLNYAGGRLHFGLVSTAIGIDEIRKAKSDGLAVSCDVGIHHLLFSDEDLTNFDTRHKVWPPYRSKQDRDALIEGVRDGTVDAIVSAHYPQDQESKWVSFDEAAFGAIGQQSFFAAILRLQDKVSLDVLWTKIVSGPRKVLGWPSPSLAIGEEARISVFDPDYTWKLDDSTNLSKSVNAPFWEVELQGKCVGMIRGTAMDWTR